MKKGFTLIELLAVIVILAVIALISVPMILGVIESSKKGAFKNSVLLSFSSAELYESQTDLITESGISIKSLKMKNNNFKYGVVFKNTTGNLEVSNVSDGAYCASGTLTDLQIYKGECDTLTPTCTYDIISGTKGLNDWYTSSPTIEFNTSVAEVSGLYYGVGITENYETTSLIEKETKTLTATIDVSANETTIFGYVKSGAGNKNTCSVTFKTDLIIPASPTVTGTSTTWTTSKTLTLGEPYTRSGILKYEYIISNSAISPTKESAITGSTNSNGLAVINSGKYIYFRTVNKAGITGEWGAAENLYVDANAPTVLTTTTLKDTTINLYDDVDLTGYAITTSTNAPSTWEVISGNSVSKVYTASSSGTYYAWVKDIVGTTKYSSFVVSEDPFCPLTIGQTYAYTAPGGYALSAVCTGYYELHTYGARGGNTFWSDTVWARGANGGFAKGTVKINKGDSIGITVGQGYWNQSMYPYNNRASTGGTTIVTNNGVGLVAGTGGTGGWGNDSWAYNNGVAGTGSVAGSVINSTILSNIQDGNGAAYIVYLGTVPATFPLNQVVNYTPGNYTTTIFAAGRYRIELAGGRGGNTLYSDVVWGRGANGGYASGIVTLAANTVLNISSGQGYWNQSMYPYNSWASNGGNSVVSTGGTNLLVGYGGTGGHGDDTWAYYSGTPGVGYVIASATSSSTQTGTNDGNGYVKITYLGA